MSTNTGQDRPNATSPYIFQTAGRYETKEHVLCWKNTYRPHSVSSECVCVCTCLYGPQVALLLHDCHRPPDTVLFDHLNTYFLNKRSQLLQLQTTNCSSLSILLWKITCWSEQPYRKNINCIGARILLLTGPNIWTNYHKTLLECC